MAVTFFKRLQDSDSTMLVDNDGNGFTYVGFAIPGSATSAAIWKIKRVDESVLNDVKIEWADGNISFDNVWDNRAGLSYS